MKLKVLGTLGRIPCKDLSFLPTKQMLMKNFNHNALIGMWESFSTVEIQSQLGECDGMLVSMLVHLNMGPGV
jgi:hypothetical protein